jgi:hypothetical protein
MDYRNNHRTGKKYEHELTCSSYSLKKVTGYIDSIDNGLTSPGQHQFFSKKYRM